MAIALPMVYGGFRPPAGRFNTDLLLRLYHEPIIGSEYQPSQQDISDAAILIGIVSGIPDGYGSLVEFKHLSSGLFRDYDWKWQITEEGIRYLREHGKIS